MAVLLVAKVTRRAVQSRTRVTEKVKSSYKVFPSAYASGAIAKCRKKAGK